MPAFERAPASGQATVVNPDSNQEVAMEAWLRPMLCQPADIVPEGDEWVLEPKIDGWRAIMYTTGAAGVRTYGGRNGSDYSGKVPYIEQEVAMILPVDSAVDGELVGRQGWGDVQGVMTRGDGPHVPDAAVPALSYVIFDVLRVRGTDVRSMPWTDRRMLLEQASWEFATHAQLSTTFPAQDGERVLAKALELGFEGLVAKRRSSRYVNTRSHDWPKIKPQTTDEARIIGFKPGKAGGRWAGKVGAFEVEMLGPNDEPTGARTTVKCGTDDRHIEATEHPERWLNVVIEILHHGKGDTGVPRHPQFWRRRDDRTAVTKVARTARTAPTKERTRMDGQPSGRNYGAMGDAKLLRCVRELRDGDGDAVERVRAKCLTDLAPDLAAAEAAATQRGLALPA